jgi:hypothetical protein
MRNHVQCTTVSSFGGKFFITTTCVQIEENSMARRYSRGVSKDVERVMRKRKKGTLRNGRSSKKVTSRKQAIAIGLSEAQKKGKKVPRRKLKL